jgi:tetratricopeptide (TPR) repeat protein
MMIKWCRRFGFHRLLLCVLLLALTAGCSKPEQRAQGYFERGMASLAKGDDLQARIELTTALKFKGDILEAWRALAGIDERTNSKQALFQDLRSIVQFDPNDLDARLKLASMMVAAGAGDAALKVLEVAKEDKPNAVLHGLKASLLARANDSAGAEREAQRAIEIDPKNLDASTVLALKKMQDGDNDGALKLLDSARIDPKDEIRVSLLKLQIYNRKKDLPQAEALLRKLVAQNPREFAFRNELIQFYIAGKRFDDAERELRSRAEANPTDIKPEMDVVRFLLSTKGPAAGQQELAARIKAGGDVFDYQIALAELQASQGNVSDATQLLQTLVGTASSPDRKLTAQVRLAEIYVNRVNFDAAEPIISEVLQKDVHNTGALRLRATIRIERGQFDNAISDLRDALNGQPKSPQLLLLMAEAYERSGKNELVERQYADALKSSNFEPGVGQLYVAYLQRKGDLEQAEGILTEVIKRNPNNSQLWTTLAEIRLKRRDWAGALAIADAITRQNGDLAVADQIRGSAFAGQNKIDQSIAALEKAHAEAPDAVQPVVGLASFYVQQGKASKADALLQSVIKKFPDNAQILVLIGQTKLAENKTDEALQNFKAAIAKQPKDAAGYNALSDLYVRQKNYAAAIDVMQSALKLQPGNINFRLTSAGLEILKGDHEAAIAQYESILKDQPDSLLAINNLASLLLDNRSDKASLTRAFALADSLKNSNIPQFEDTVGWAQYKRGDFKSAVSTLEASQVKLPNLAAVRYHLGMSYIAAGQPEMAAGQFKAAFALEPDGTPLKESIRSAMK